jgi:predicted deacylase
MAGLRRWVAGLESRSFRGTVRAVPVVNLPAFWARSPFVVPEDGKNLNRSFPGAPDGTLTERMADAIYTTLIRGSDALVDMHAGDMVEALEPFALYDEGPAEAEARGMAAAYGVGYVLRNAAVAGPGFTVNGSTSAVAAAAGIPAIIAEAGGCGLVEEAAVQAHVRGLDGVLGYLEMTPGAAAPSPGPEFLDGWSWPRTTSAGWWSPAVQAGTRVTAGQLLGTVSTLDGAEVLETFTAAAAGVVLFLTSSPAVAADGLLLGLATT